jgi:hypothetical protein
VAINFSDRILITNPTAYHLGRAIVFIALGDIAIGAITYYFGDFLWMPPLAWCIIAAPKLLIGVILVACGLTKP